MVRAAMERLRELALSLPRPGCDWEEQPRFDPPASPETLAAFERTAGFPMPADFRAFLAEAESVVGMSVHNGYWIGGIGRLSFAGLPPSVAGEPVAPVATDGGGNAFLLSARGRVWRWDHERGSVSAVSASFGEFLGRVAEDWAAYVNDEPGWRYLV